MVDVFSLVDYSHLKRKHKVYNINKKLKKPLFTNLVKLKSVKKKAFYVQNVIYFFPVPRILLVSAAPVKKTRHLSATFDFLEFFFFFCISKFM